MNKLEADALSIGQSVGGHPLPEVPPPQEDKQEQLFLSRFKTRLDKSDIPASSHPLPPALQEIADQETARKGIEENERRA